MSQRIKNKTTLKRLTKQNRSDSAVLAAPSAASVSFSPMLTPIQKRATFVSLTKNIRFPTDVKRLWVEAALLKIKLLPSMKALNFKQFLYDSLQHDSGTITSFAAIRFGIPIPVPRWKFVLTLNQRLLATDVGEFYDSGQIYDTLFNIQEFYSLKRILKLFSHYFNIVYKECSYDILDTPYHLSKLANNWEILLQESDHLLDLSRELRVRTRRGGPPKYSLHYLAKLNRGNSSASSSEGYDADSELTDFKQFADQLHSYGSDIINKILKKKWDLEDKLAKSLAEANIAQSPVKETDSYFEQFLCELQTEDTNVTQNMPEFITTWLKSLQLQFDLPYVQFTSFILCSALAYFCTGKVRMLAIAFAIYCGSQCLLSFPAIRDFLYDPIAMFTSMPCEPTATLPYIKRLLRSLSDFLLKFAGDSIKKILSLFSVDPTDILEMTPLPKAFGTASNILTRRIFDICLKKHFKVPTSYDDPSGDDIQWSRDEISLLKELMRDSKVPYQKPWNHPSNYLNLFSVDFDLINHPVLINIIYAISTKWERYEQYFVFKADAKSEFKRAVVYWSGVPVSFKKVPLVNLPDIQGANLSSAFLNWPKKNDLIVNPLASCSTLHLVTSRSLLRDFVQNFVTCSDELPLAATQPLKSLRDCPPVRAWKYDEYSGIELNSEIASSSGENSNVTQSFSDSWESFISFLTSIFDKDSVFGSTRIQERLRNFNTTYTAFAKLTPLFAWIPACIITVIDTIGIKMFGYSPSFTMKPKLMHEITALLNEVTKLEASVAISKDTADMVMRIEALSARFAIASSQLHILDQGDARCLHFRAAHRRFCELAVVARARHASETPRCPPLCVYLPGPAGIGKTNLAQALAQELALPLKEGTKPLLRNKEIYTMDFKANFQDGLTNQATIIADEWNSFNNAEMRLSGISWLLAAVNSTQIVVEKARAEEKGMYYFNAELLFLTSNGELSSLDSLLADPQAIKRRLSHTVDIIPPPMKNGLFPQKPDGSIDFDTFTFTVTVLGETPQVMTFQDLYESIARKLVSTRNLFNATLDNKGSFKTQVDRSKLADLEPVQVNKIHEPIGGVSQPAPYVPSKGSWLDTIFGTQGTILSVPTKCYYPPELLVELVHLHKSKIDQTKSCTFSTFLKWIRTYKNTIGIPFEFDCDVSAIPAWKATMFALGLGTLPTKEEQQSDSTQNHMETLMELTVDKKESKQCSSYCRKAKQVLLTAVSIVSAKILPTSFYVICNVVKVLQNDSFWTFLKLAAGCVIGGFIGYGIYKYVIATPTVKPFEHTWEKTFDERYSEAQGMVGSGNARREALDKHRRNRRSLNVEGEFMHSKDNTNRDRTKLNLGDVSANESRHIQRKKGSFAPRSTTFTTQSAATDLSYTVGKNTLFITTPFDVEYRAISPGGRYIIMPHHYLRILRDAGDCTLRSDNGSATIDFSKTDIYLRPDMDMCAFLAPLRLPAFPEISHRFIKDDDVPYVHDSFIHFLKKESGQMATTTLTETVVPTTQSWSPPDAMDREQAYVASVYSFRHTTYVGDCGSLYATSRGSVTSRNFIGYHVSGNGRSAQCTILTQEDIQAVYDAFEGNYAVASTTQGFSSLLKAAPAVHNETDIEAMFDPLPQSASGAKAFEAYRTAPLHAVILSVDEPSLHNSRKSRFSPSPLAGILGDPASAPAYMTRYEDPQGRDPLIEAYKRQTTLPLDLDDVSPKVLYESAVASLSYVKRYQNGLTRTLSPYEAVLGFHALAPMKLNASAGEPYNSLAQKLGKPPSKESWIKIPQANMVDFQPVLLADVHSTMALLKQGIVPSWYVTDQLKDETVSFAKLEACKTRLYYTASVLHVLIARMLFGSLISAMEDSRMKAVGLASCAVGMSTEDFAVREMYREMTDPQKQIFAMDQKGFDNHQHWAIGKHVARAINAWYDESDELSMARYTFLKSCYHSIHRIGSIKYQVPFGMPSGIAITAQLNSIYLETVTLSALHIWSKTRPSLDANPSTSIPVIKLKNAMFALYYGDDSWFSFPKHYGLRSKDLFDVYRKFGLEATHCIKDFDINQEVPAHLTSFLKRVPVLNNDQELVFRKDLDDIGDILSWCKRKYVGNWTIQRDIVRSVLYEYRLHGIQCFEEKFKLIKAAFDERGITMTLSPNHRDYVIN